jgi:hypothetical protein
VPKIQAGFGTSKLVPFPYVPDRHGRLVASSTPRKGAQAAFSFGALRSRHEHDREGHGFSRAENILKKDVRALAPPVFRFQRGFPAARASSPGRFRHE